MCISRNNGIARPLKQEQRKSTQMKDSILYKVTKRELFINKCQHLFVFFRTSHSTSQFKSLYALINRFSKPYSIKKNLHFLRSKLPVIQQRRAIF